MTSINIRLDLPEALAKEAEEAGLLTPQAMEAMLRDKVRRRHLDRMADNLSRLGNVGVPPLSEEEIQAEIAAARARL